MDLVFLGGNVITMTPSDKRAERSRFGTGR